MKTFIKTFVITLAGLLLFADYLSAGVLTGKVYDEKSGQPVSFATIRVENTTHTMLTNESGQYRLRLKPDNYRIKFSHVAHHSQIREVTVTDADMTLDIQLEEALIVIPGTKVYERDYDAAQSIIIEAINRKEALLSQLQSIQFDAYTKLVVRDSSKEDSSSILAITESQLVCYWKQPDNYNQTITARKVSSNLSNAEILVAIGDIPNFNKNRIHIGSYSIVSPTATDALEHYNYYLLDTIYIDNKAIFRLEIEPKDPLDPLFFGTVDIADSTFAVVGVEVGFSEGVEIQYMSDLRYSQRYDQFEGKYWMPIEVRLNGDVDITIPGLPVFTIDYVAALHNYTFEPIIPKGTFDYSLEVAEYADDVDSITWDSGQLIPLTTMEIRGYERIDSVTNAPKPVFQQILSKTLWLTGEIISNDDFFHFNRVEGTYLGFNHRWRKLLPHLTLDTKLGYAFSSELWQYRAGLTYRLWKRKRMDLSFDYFDNTTIRQVLNTTGATSYTIMSLANKTDPFDYYRDKGIQYLLSRRSGQAPPFNSRLQRYPSIQPGKQHRVQPVPGQQEAPPESAHQRWQTPLGHFQLGL